jgi:hypothetical protein
LSGPFAFFDSALSAPQHAFTAFAPVVLVGGGALALGGAVVGADAEAAAASLLAAAGAVGWAASDAATNGAAETAGAVSDSSPFLQQAATERATDANRTSLDAEAMGNTRRTSCQLRAGTPSLGDQEQPIEFPQFRHL